MSHHGCELCFSLWLVTLYIVSCQAIFNVVVANKSISLTCLPSHWFVIIWVFLELMNRNKGKVSIMYAQIILLNAHRLPHSNNSNICTKPLLSHKPNKLNISEKSDINLPQLCLAHLSVLDWKHQNIVCLWQHLKCHL